MHLNPAFVKFVNDAHLTNRGPDRASRGTANIKFITRAAIVETKEAWMIIPDAVGAALPPQAATFITTQAMVPTLSVDPVAGVIAHDDQLRMVTVAMIAIHIVHTIPGHPEFIWSSFQHANRTTGVTDLAPSAARCPVQNRPPHWAATSSHAECQLPPVRAKHGSGRREQGRLRPCIERRHADVHHAAHQHLPRVPGLQVQGSRHR